MSDKKKEIILDLSECNSCTGCTDLNPEIFGWDDDQNKPFLKRFEATEEEIRDSISCCPGDCISLKDD